MTEELDPQTKSTVVQGILSGAGRSNPEEFLLLRKIAAFLCVVGLICVILGGASLIVGLEEIIRHLPRRIQAAEGGFALPGLSLLLWGILIYVSGAILKLLLAIEGHLREVRDHFRNQRSD